MSAETGVGPAMASGSQVCSGNWPDLPTIASISAAAHHRISVWPTLAFERRRELSADDVERADARRALHDEERHDHAGQQADVAGAGGEERLERGVAVRLLLPPVADEHERAQADELPADEQLQRVVGDDEQQHRRGEQRERGVEVRVAAVAAHVLERVDVHEQRDQRDDEHHHHREAVDLDAGGEAHAAVLEPGDVVQHREDRRLARPRRRDGRCCARARRARCRPWRPGRA